MRLFYEVFMRHLAKNTTHTVSLVTRLLAADLDSHTQTTNRQQLDKLKELLKHYEDAIKNL